METIETIVCDKVPSFTPNSIIGRPRFQEYYPVGSSTLEPRDSFDQSPKRLSIADSMALTVENSVERLFRQLD